MGITEVDCKIEAMIRQEIHKLKKGEWYEQGH